MRPLVLSSCVLFLSLPVCGQTELKADLLSHASSGQLATDLKALSEKTHEPSMLSIDMFANGLVRALSGHSLREADAATLVKDVDAVFKSAGTSTIRFLDHVASFKAALGSIGVPGMEATTLSNQLEKLGRQVRGPDDTPVDLAPARRQK